MRKVGPRLTSVKSGDNAILYTAECRLCKSCLSGKINLCAAIRATQGQGLSPRWHDPVQLLGPADLSLHGLFGLFELHRPSREYPWPRSAMTRFGFPRLISYCATYKPLPAGTVLAARNLSNYDEEAGGACIAERRLIEQKRTGAPITPSLQIGDEIEIEMLDREGASISERSNSPFARADLGNSTTFHMNESKSIMLRTACRGILMRATPGCEPTSATTGSVSGARSLDARL